MQVSPFHRLLHVCCHGRRATKCIDDPRVTRRSVISGRLGYVAPARALVVLGLALALSGKSRRRLVVGQFETPCVDNQLS